MLPKQPAERASLLSNLYLRYRADWVGDVILAGLRGSHAHGTALPEDHEYATEDVDLFGVWQKPTSWYLGLQGYRNQEDNADTSGEYVDVVNYDIRKFVYLLIKGNPNVHSWLWCDEEDLIISTPEGRYLRANRDLFLSQRVLRAIGGYAKAQLERMTRGKRSGYMGEKRKKLMDKHGYDVKNAAHAIRLLHLGKRLAITGKLDVKLGGFLRGKLRMLKGGEYPMKQVVRDFRDLDRAFQEAWDYTDLQEEPDERACNRVLVECMTGGFWCKK